MGSGRTILHVDMDAFFVSVELRRRPELRGRPVAVGGQAGRGVIAAASYEARRYGVHSALPTSTALRRCPQLIVLPGDHPLYSEVSSEVHEIFDSFTPLVEPLALDEAFLDVTGAVRSANGGAEIGHAIRTRIRERLALDSSVGVATNKLLAKLASVAAKPVATPDGVRAGAGVVEVDPDAQLEFLHPLPVRALWGVGPATFAKLARFGVATVGDLARIPVDTLVTSLGAHAGAHLHELAWGRDPRPVEPDRAIKSIGHEETFADDRYTTDQLHHELVRLADGVASRLRAHGLAARTLTLKVRYRSFRTLTRAVTLPTPVTTAHDIVSALAAVLEAIDASPGVRLLGVSASRFVEGGQQLQLALPLELGSASGSAGSSTGLPDAADGLELEWTRAEAAVDEIRDRFGRAAIAPASALRRGRLRTVHTGAQQWGPTGPEPSEPGPSESDPTARRGEAESGRAARER